MAVLMDVFLLPETNSQFAPENRGRILPKKERDHLPAGSFQGRNCCYPETNKDVLPKGSLISLPTIHFQVRTVNNSGSG